VLPYAAYLRVYEPLTAFPEPERSMWAAYAAGAGRLGREHTIDAEHAGALGRLVAAPPETVPCRESRDAYVRLVDGAAYVCPWQTRLRSWLALERFLASVPARLAGAFVPPAVSERSRDGFRRWKQRHGTVRLHILSSTWRVPLPWFMSFDPAERWLVLRVGSEAAGPGAAEPGIAGPGVVGPDAGAGTADGGVSGAAGPAGGRATATRTLIYLTSLAQASRRLSRALGAVCRDPAACLPSGGVEDLRRWLTEFHPRSLVELDYGGLVHLLDDEALRSDQSVAEAAAAIAGLETGQNELTAAMCERLTDRWRLVEALESAN
jgi:hypothetical protein